MEGGHKADFTSYIVNMWKSIGYNPNSIKNDENVTGENIHQQIGGKFTPKKYEPEVDKFAGVVIKNIPIDVDHGLIMEFLIQNGLPEKNREYVKKFREPHS